MNDHLTISTFQLFKMFPDAESARVYLESRRWPKGPRCPVCGLTDRITVRKGGYYRCGQCREDFTVRTGTIFERSHVPLHKWIVALGMLAECPEVPSETLATELNVTQKTGWLISKRIHESAGAAGFHDWLGRQSADYIQGTDRMSAKGKRRARWYMAYHGECPVCGRWRGWKEARYTKPPPKAQRYEQLPQELTYDHCLQ